ncbi:FkbM family methyltransferase [Nocardia miyunensis]|uniref:FkbM family methyltransferase n=1 Tax=Nocardia miyunensis TaxID=282684 RepID=UPI000AF0A557|nr:FkbM family methyltransferase [Nocardia miyunensis]
MEDAAHSRSAPAIVSDVLGTLGRGYVRHAAPILVPGLLAEWVNRVLRSQPRERLARTRSGERTITDSGDLIQRYIALFGVWEPHLSAWLRTRLRPGDGFVDVGANIGVFTLLASAMVGEHGRVVALEASPQFHRRLVEHTDLNGRANVRAVNTAVSDRDEELTFILASTSNLGAASMVPYDGPAESVFTVDARPLTDLLTPDEIAATRIVKIDVEGAEGRVVRGLAALLDRLRPDAEFVIEVTPDRMRRIGDDVDELLTIMRDSGFHSYRLPTDYRARSYPPALRHPQPPVRWRGRIEDETELVFSRIDAETLR